MSLCGSFDSLPRPVAILTRGYTPTLYYWFNNIEKQKEIVLFDTQNIDLKNIDLSIYNSIILVRIIDLRFFNVVNDCSLYDPPKMFA